MMDPGLDLHRLGDERLNDVHRNPRRAEARGDLARLEIDGLDRFESGGDSKESRIGFGLLTRKGEPGSHMPRERLVGGHPEVEMRRGAPGNEIDVAGKLGERLDFGAAEPPGYQQAHYHTPTVEHEYHGDLHP